MLAVNDTAQQADAHLIRTAHKTILIDAGYPGGPLVPLLKRHGVSHVDLVLISHPHKDHYGGLRALLQSDVSVGRIVMNDPPKARCDQEIPWGCDWKDLRALETEIREKKIPLGPSRAGDRLVEDGESSLVTLVAHDGVSPPVGDCDINDLSLVVRLTVGPHRALFTGDLNEKLGGYLAAHEPDLQAGILKVPHHGTEGVAPNAFFARVAPELALVPGPRALWRSDRSKRIRDYFRKAGIPTLISGEAGDVTVEFFPREWNVRTERAIH